MSPRKLIYAMFAAGLVLILVLTFIPYSLLTRARQAVVTAVLPSGENARSVEPPPARAPLVDVERWYAEREEQPERHGVLVETADRSATLADHNADKTFNPASLIKLATTLLVMRRAGADFRFETRVYTEGETDPSGTLKGRVFIAGGDPTFGDHAASLVARELRERGVKQLDGELLVTPDFSFNYNEKAEESVGLAAKVMGLKEKATGVGDVPAGASPLFVLRSHPLREILLYMNAHSSNFVAERLCARVGGPEAVRNLLVAELGLPGEQVEIQRCSGRERNRMTARGVLAVLRALDAEAARQQLRLEDLMPVASDDAGTLRRRLEGSPLDGALVGKTGTLTAEVDGGMASLAGVVYTERAGKLYFAILDQGSHIAENRELEDLLLAQVILAHDIPRPVDKPEERRRLLPPENLEISDK